MTDPAVFAARLDRALRDEGVAAGTRRARTLAEALTALPPASREALYWTARVTMLGTIDDIAAFERAFDRLVPRVAAEHLDAFAAIDAAERPLPAPAARERTAPAPGERLPEGAEPRDASTVWLLAAPDEHLAERDFDAFGEDERAAMLRLVAGARIPREPRTSRRRKPDRAGDRFDLARTLRGAARTQGELVRRRYTERRERLRPLIFVLDVSGSMLPFARALLQYARVAARARPRVFAFAFATRLTDLSALLRRADDATLAGALGEALRDYGGGTQIGAALRAFNDRYAQRGIARDGTVIILSDGWERGDPRVLADEMARLRRLARRIVWVNPHKRHPAYEPLVAGMAAALPYVDDFVAGHNLRALDAIATLLETAVTRGGTMAAATFARRFRRETRSHSGMITRLAGALGALVFTLLSCAPVTAQTAPGVLVVGGTPAGVAAAVAAARRGADVTLVARRPVLGGVLTDAMMDQWDLNLNDDGASVQGGLFDEIEAMLGDSFTPADAARAFGELVAREPRIRVVTDAQPIAVATTLADGEKHVTAVTFADTRDRRTFALDAPEVIDATDDGDVAALAGASYDLGRQDTGIDERMQAVTLMFTLEDVDWTTVARDYRPATYGPGGALDRRAWGYAKLMERYRPLAPDVLVRDLNFGHEDGDAVTVNAIDVVGIDGLVPADLQRARALAEAETPHLVAFLRANLPGFERARIGRFADALYVRETRHFAGLERLTAGDVWDGKIPNDTIGLSSYPLDLHPVTPTDRAAFAPTRHVYGLPFGTMIPRGFANLILASPAISASHIASGSARIIPTTIEEGEAAGAASALAARNGRSFATIATSPSAMLALRDDLRAHGTILAPPTDVDVALRGSRG